MSEKAQGRSHAAASSFRDNAREIALRTGALITGAASSASILMAAAVTALTNLPGLTHYVEWIPPLANNPFAACEAMGAVALATAAAVPYCRRRPHFVLAGALAGAALTVLGGLAYLPAIQRQNMDTIGLRLSGVIVGISDETGPGDSREVKILSLAGRLPEIRMPPILRM